MDEQGCIGLKGKLPWHLSADLKRFKKLTMGHHLIMGRLTYESIRRVLPGRVMIVVTRSLEYYAPGCMIANSIDEAVALADARQESEVFVIGGGEIFSQTIGRADRLYLTRIHANVDCDTYFPSFAPAEWQQVESSFHLADEENQYPSTYQLLIR
jgi:dihydrofolate reductase